MTSYQIAICERLKRIGYSEGHRIRLYGREFDLISDPFALRDNLVFVDGVETKSGMVSRVRVPLSVVQMMRRESAAVEPSTKVLRFLRANKKRTSTLGYGV